jgi:hypothetical protein
VAHNNLLLSFHEHLLFVEDANEQNPFLFYLFDERIEVLSLKISLKGFDLRFSELSA